MVRQTYISLFLVFLTLLVSPSVYGGQKQNFMTGKVDFCSTIQEEDGSPSMVACQQLKVTNGDLTDNGDGTFSLATASAAAASEWTDTGTVLHPTDSSGTLDNVVVGGTTQAGADIILNVDGSAVFNEQAGSTGDFRIESATNANMFFIDYSDDEIHIDGTTGVDTVNIHGDVDIIHVAVEAQEHALELEVDAAGFGDIKALEIEYDTGAIATGQIEAVILVDINQIDATGGDVIGLEVLSTDGGADNIVGMKAGAVVAPILQDSGVFLNATLATNDTNTTDVPDMRDGSTGTNTTIFVLDDDFIIIGADTAFTEIEFIVETGFGAPGIKPVFAFSTVGTNQFTNFTPTDGTNGFKNAGAFVVAWDADEVPGFVADDVTMKFDIRITRTANPSGNVSLFFAKTAATTVFEWDENADLLINTVSLESNGVKLSGDNDGALEKLGLGNGSDECLSENYDDTANTVVYSNCASSTSVDTLEYSGLDAHYTGSGPDVSFTATGGTKFGLHADTNLFYWRENAGTIFGLGRDDGHLWHGAYGHRLSSLTVLTDGTGDGEVNLPNDSIGIQELDAIDEPADAERYAFDSATGRGEWVAAGSVEGTAVLSTGEGGGTKFLREDGDGTSSWQAAGGGGTANLSVELLVQSAKLTGSFVTDQDATQGAQIDGGDGNWRLLFDATTDEAAVWQFRMPNNYSSDPIFHVGYSMTSATTADVEFEGAIMCVSDGDSVDVGTPSFSTIAVVTETVPGTAGFPSEVSITLNDDSCVAADTTWLYLSTDADDATNDDATGDREVIHVSLTYTGS